MTDREKITRAEAVGLWHAVRAYSDMINAMGTMGEFTAAQIDVEERRIADAKRALAKIQKMRRAAKPGDTQ